MVYLAPDRVRPVEVLRSNGAAGPTDPRIGDKYGMLAASETFDDMAIVKIRKEIVPEYKSQHSKYQELDK